MKSYKYLIMPFLCLVFFNNCFCFENFYEVKKMVVSVPVADLMIKPELPDYKKNKENIKYPVFGYSEYDDFEHSNNPLLDSQLLLNDKLFLYGTSGDWLVVGAIEQPTYDKQTRTFVPKLGCIKKDQAVFVQDFQSCNLVVKNQWANIYKSYSNEKDDNSILMKVSIGTKLKGDAVEPDSYMVFLPYGKVGVIKAEDVYFVDEKIEESVDKIRESLYETAQTFFGFPYSWGGRSSWDFENKKQQTGIDCSSFINLVYRANGFEIPRDANDQYLFCNHIVNGSDLKPGDLIFFESDNRKGKMYHVLMYLGFNLIMECDGQNVFRTRSITDFELFDSFVENMQSGKEYNGKKVYFGSFLNKPETLQGVRTFFKGGSE